MGNLRGLQNALSFNSRSSSSTIYPTTETLETRLDLQRLHESGNYLSTGWIRKALDMCLSMHREIQEIFPQIGHAVQPQTSKWVDETLDETVKLLDACNGIRDNMIDIKQYHEKLYLVVHILNGSIGPWQMLKARTALESLIEIPAKSTEPPQNKSRLENCSSILRRKGGKSAAPCQGGELIEQIHVAMDFTVFVCDLLSAALSIRSRQSLAPPWAAIQALQLKVKEEVEKRKIKGPACFLLDEVCAVDSASQGLYDLLKVFMNCESGPLEEGRDLELRQSVVCLRECIAELEDGMDSFENQINELFKLLVDDRMALLDALAYS